MSKPKRMPSLRALAAIAAEGLGFEGAESDFVTREISDSDNVDHAIKRMTTLERDAQTARDTLLREKMKHEGLRIVETDHEKVVSVSASHVLVREDVQAWLRATNFFNWNGSVHYLDAIVPLWDGEESLTGGGLPCPADLKGELLRLHEQEGADIVWLRDDER